MSNERCLWLREGGFRTFRRAPWHGDYQLLSMALACGAQEDAVRWYSYRACERLCFAQSLQALLGNEAEAVTVFERNPAEPVGEAGQHTRAGGDPADAGVAITCRVDACTIRDGQVLDHLRQRVPFKLQQSVFVVVDRCYSIPKVSSIGRGENDVVGVGLSRRLNAYR